ncbi:MAG TPA: cation-translocating P-type ATPase C-terminal domain-containing protein, partial [Pyrinomonadaceae bacterium]|nr:cation-translocating P-type ATPase C-terminal domain-containing protein [Pyrinomonadaceae bacterium]
FNCRSRTRSAFAAPFKNPFIWIATVIVISLQLLAIYFSPLARVLDTVEPLAVDWIVIAVCTVAPILIVEITKAFARRQKKAAPLASSV